MLTEEFNELEGFLFFEVRLGKHHHVVVSFNDVRVGFFAGVSGVTNFFLAFAYLLAVCLRCIVFFWLLL